MLIAQINVIGIHHHDSAQCAQKKAPPHDRLYGKREREGWLLLGGGGGRERARAREHRMGLCGCTRESVQRIDFERRRR